MDSQRIASWNSRIGMNRYALARVRLAHRRPSSSVVESADDSLVDAKLQRVHSLPVSQQDRVYRNMTGWKSDIKYERAFDRRYRVPDYQNWRKGILTKEQKDMIAALKKCADSLDWEKALEISKTIPEDAGQDWQPVCRGVLSCLCKALRYHEAKQTFERLPQKDTPAYNFMLLMLARLRYVDELHQMLWEMDNDGVPRSAVTYCHIMSSCVATHSWSEALRTLDTLKTDSALHGGANWDVAYLLPMTACARATQREKVEGLLEEYKASGKGTPDRNHYNALIVACGSDAQAAQKVFGDLRAEGWTPARPDWHALMLCHTDCQEQRHVFAQMRQELPDARFEEAWAILLRTAIRNDDSEGAAWVLQDMSENGCDADSPTIKVPSLRRAISSWRARQRDEQLHRAWESAPPAEQMVPPETSRPSVDGESELPHGWQSTVDPNTGQPYYWRTEDPTGTTTWDRPVQWFKNSKQFFGTLIVSLRSTDIASSRWCLF